MTIAPRAAQGTAPERGDWFRSLIEAAPEVYFRYAFAPERRFVYASPSIKAVTGHTPEEFYADPAFCLALVPREDRKVLHQIVRARRGLKVDLRITPRHGTTVALRLRTVPVVRHRAVVAVEGIASVVAGFTAAPGRPDREQRGGRRMGGLELPAEPVQQRLTALLYEVHGLLHRALPPASNLDTIDAARGAILRAGDVALDTRRLTVTLAGAPVSLTPRELLVLRYLFLHPGRVVTRRQLLTDVWGNSYSSDDRTVDVHVSRLRAKLPPLEDRLVTVKHVGYRLAADDDAVQCAAGHIANF